MPDNQSTGELEDFIQRLIPADDAVWPRAEGYIDGIPAESLRRGPSRGRWVRPSAWAIWMQRTRSRHSW